MWIVQNAVILTMSQGKWTIHSFVQGAEAADEVRNTLEEAEQEAKKERLAELGYPDDYDPTNPVSNGEFTEDDWDAIQQEEAMRSLAEDAMNNYYQEKPDISDEVLKP